jgi:hypothetical protein
MIRPSCSQARIPLYAAAALLGATGCQQPLSEGESLSYIISTDQPLSVRQLVRTARVLREYRQLTAAELTEISQRLSRIFEALVDAELEQMKQQAIIQHQPMPTRREARQRVAQRMGHILALPILTSETQSVVAFGKITDSSLELTPTAYQVDTPVAGIEPGGEIRTSDGQKATLVGK